MATTSYLQQATAKTGDFLTCSVALRSTISYPIFSQKMLNLKCVNLKVIYTSIFDSNSPKVGSLLINL